MVADDYTSTFALSLLRKDMGIALNCALEKEGLSMPLAECAYELYKKASAFDREDCSAIAKIG